MRWWSEELSTNQYDGIIGLSQGAAMTALLISMVGLIHGIRRVLGMVANKISLLYSSIILR